MLGREGRASKVENCSNVSIRYPPTIQITSTLLALPLRVKARRRHAFRPDCIASIVQTFFPCQLSEQPEFPLPLACGEFYTVKKLSGGGSLRGKICTPGRYTIRILPGIEIAPT